MDAPALIDGLRHHYVAWLTVTAALTVFEVLNPREDHSLRSRLLGAGFWVVSLTLSVVAMATFAVAWEYLGVTPFFTISTVQATLGGPMVSVILGALLGLLVNDFFFYWYHRFQHRWLWRWHAVHHSIEQLNATNSYHHPSEALTTIILMQIPMSLLIGIHTPVSPIVNFIVACHIVWIHSPTRMTFGPLRAVLVDNRFHRIHHSLEPAHFDKNFGAFTTLWDRLFGTCHMPGRSEWPSVGITAARQPRSFGEWVALPWRMNRDVPKPDAEPSPHIPAPTSPAWAGVAQQS